MHAIWLCGSSMQMFSPFNGHGPLAPKKPHAADLRARRSVAVVRAGGQRRRDDRGEANRSYEIPKAGRTGFDENFRAGNLGRKSAYKSLAGVFRARRRTRVIHDFPIQTPILKTHLISAGDLRIGMKPAIEQLGDNDQEGMVRLRGL